MEKPNSDQNPVHQLMSDTISSDDQHQASQYSSSARSYDCSFCKRGFTNAQALGGHMNIHRKDKAKLKELANFSIHETRQQQQQQQQSLEIPKVTNKPSYSSPNDLPIMSNSNFEEYKDSNTILGDDQYGNIVTTTSWFLNQKPESDDHERGTSLSAGRGSSLDPELDLELRLGPEPPQDSSSSAVATRKFF